jgi:hypothetical protein
MGDPVYVTPFMTPFTPHTAKFEGCLNFEARPDFLIPF